MEAQLKKGVLEMCVLSLIRDREMYGYDVMKSLKKHFPEVNESTFYAILRRLHADGHAQISLADPSQNAAPAAGPTRKYYMITPKGREYLAVCANDWHRIRGIVEHLGI